MSDNQEGKMNPKFRVFFKWFNDQMLPVEVEGPDGTRCVREGEVVMAVFVGYEMVYCAKGFTPSGAV